MTRFFQHPAAWACLALATFSPAARANNVEELPAPGASERIPPASMPLSKFWRRSFVSRVPVPHDRFFLNVPVVARPVGGPASDKVDLNSATLEDLQNLPGVGAAMGAHIMAGRPYRTFDDLLANGVPASTVERIRPLVELGVIK